MESRRQPAGSAPKPPPLPGLRALRRRLTAWYVGTFALTILALAAVLLVAISRQISGEFGRLLADTADEAERSARIETMDRPVTGEDVAAAIAALDVPGQPVYLYDADSRSVRADPGPPVVGQLADRARRAGQADTTVTIASQRWRMHGKRFSLAGTDWVVVVAADTEPMERQLDRLLGAFALTGLLAAALVGLGGWRLARLSSLPAERAMQRMRQFVAEAAHELRTPIALIRARADTALRHPRDADAYRAALEALAGDAERLGRLADDLLLLARIDSGVRQPARDAVFLDDLVADAIGSASDFAAARHIRLELRRYEEAPILGDPVLLRRLLTNLLDNALRYTPEGGTVSADVFREDDRARVRITDTGPGIPEHVLPRVFDRFYRSDEDGLHPGGAGLGLAIAGWIARAHGGELRLDPAAGGGTIAAFSMRIARARSRPETAGANREISSGDPRVRERAPAG